VLYLLEINKIINNRNETAIIIAPTRELAIQIEKEFSDLFPKEPTFICGKIEDEYGLN
jgi:superfamily II DNA/RNA helicase